MLFLLPLLLCGVHSKHFLIETQDTDVQSEDLVKAITKMMTKDEEPAEFSKL